MAGEGAVEVVATRSYGPDAVEVTWTGADGLGDRILYREDEPRIREVAPGRRWAFDGDEDAFRLASEALRIRLANLFDSYVTVNASHVKPLPERLTAVNGPTLSRQTHRLRPVDDSEPDNLPETDRVLSLRFAGYFG